MHPWREQKVGFGPEMYYRIIDRRTAQIVGTVRYEPSIVQGWTWVAYAPCPDGSWSREYAHCADAKRWVWETAMRITA